MPLLWLKRLPVRPNLSPLQMYKNFEGAGASTGVFTRDYRWAGCGLGLQGALKRTLAPGWPCLAAALGWRRSAAHHACSLTRPLSCLAAPPWRRHNVEGCRILVTVPACLEILLLSPSSQAWVRRIRYAILDEVRI